LDLRLLEGVFYAVIHKSPSVTLLKLRLKIYKPLILIKKALLLSVYSEITI